MFKKFIVWLFRVVYLFNSIRFFSYYITDRDLDSSTVWFFVTCFIMFVWFYFEEHLIPEVLGDRAGSQ